MLNLYYSFCSFCSSAIAPIANLFARFYVGYHIFFVSGLLKLEDFEGAVELFEEDWVIPLLPATPAAFMATAGELVLPVLLILGLFTRFAALGLFVMTVVIQVFVLQDSIHYLWMAVLALLIAYGGDKISLDRFLLKGRG